MEKKKSFTVELIGPAGAGKTTIRKTLLERDSRVRHYPHPDLSKKRDLPFFVLNFLASLPVLARMAMVKDGLKINSDELAYMVILQGWSEPLKRQARRRQGIILLDQGPVYILAVQAFFRSPVFQSSVLKKWWETLYRRWAGTVEAVIYLDTDDEVLIQRINTRGKWHRVLGKDEETAEDFLAQSRKSLDETMHALCKWNPNLQILKLNTREKSVDQIYAEISELFASRID